MSVGYPPDMRYRCDFCPPGSPMILWAKKDEHNLAVHPDLFGKPERRPAHMFQGYSEHYGTMLESQQHKIAELIEHQCIEYKGGGVYICKPIEGYNKNTYRLRKDEDGVVTCTCQYFRINHQMCAHIGALYEFWARGQVYSAIECSPR